MKSFAQYINELRQNYIFGGIDNRNANVTDKIKTFEELEDGDIIYWWCNERPKIIRECIFKCWSNPNYANDGAFETHDDNSYYMEFVDKSKPIYTEIYQKHKYYAASTDLDLLITTVWDKFKRELLPSYVIPEKELFKRL